MLLNTTLQDLLAIRFHGPAISFPGQFRSVAINTNLHTYSLTSISFMFTAEPHHIIAIGASACGLDELNTFFDHTPVRWHILRYRSAFID